ncbi:GIY-YIG nuclease family protein [Savagea sp. SN6]|uniref:GIY-YIG nuclease family protein n=1 Tax=Savagea serpentis TaxID=2785297 RepID=A0A8J7G8V5_9BACL|nr:GIY-YIG nuclease family protein [Savagea serpentis]MBF4502306.1 GIY-YIG nuclease family protein [Savagea serpentis]
MENEHCFYVLRCADRTYYTGYTNHLTKRVQAHNEGKGAKYTRGRRPVQCIYSERFKTKTEAMRAEYAFKQKTRKQKEQYIKEALEHANTK